MSYNPNSQPRSGGIGRKAKRVSDVASLGMAASPPGFQPPQQQYGASAPYPGDAYGADPSFSRNSPPPYNDNRFDSPPNYGFNAGPPNQNYGQFPGAQSPLVSTFMQNPSQIGTMFQQPMVQGMAMEFGQQIATQGKDMVHKKLETIISVSELKYFFAVDTRYVMKKIFLLLFPFTHRDWSIKYDQDHPIQPRYETNAPDLYIPTMAYVTYIVLTGIVLGFQNRFSPEKIGIQASSVLAYNIFELFIYAATKYITNIQTRIGIYDLIAYSGYKYVMMIAAVSTSIIFKGFGYYLCLIYCSIALSFFLMRTLKVQILADPSQHNYTQNVYSQPRYSGGTKRKTYFMLLIVLLQPILSWWLSYHLVFYSVSKDGVSGGSS